MLSLIQLRSASFSEVSIRECPSGTFEAPLRFAHSIKLGVVDKEKRLWRMEMHWHLEENPATPFAYSGHLKVSGILQVHEEVSAEQEPDVVKLSGATLLYGVIREMVSTITSRCEKGHLMLPTLSFRSILEKNSSERRRTAVRRSNKSPA